MKISKVLNNNAVIVKDMGEEKIAIGPGVGYSKSKNDILLESKIEKLFILRENKQLGELFERIPEEHILIAEDIINKAKTSLTSELGEHSRLGLTDHLSFAIQRAKDGIHLKNKLLAEIRLLYKEEFEIGLWAIKHVKKELNIKLPIDEAAFLAVHIHTMKIRGGDLKETIRQTGMIRDMVEAIEACLQIRLEENKLSYERLITHLRFALIRVEEGKRERMDQDMFQLIQEKFPQAYKCSLQVAKIIKDKHRLQMTKDELGYITLHIERLRTL